MKYHVTGSHVVTLQDELSQLLKERQKLVSCMDVLSGRLDDAKGKLFLVDIKLGELQAREEANESRESDNDPLVLIHSFSVASFELFYKLRRVFQDDDAFCPRLDFLGSGLCGPDSQVDRLAEQV